jgi:hypothetical protein
LTPEEDSVESIEEVRLGEEDRRPDPDRNSELLRDINQIRGSLDGEPLAISSSTGELKVIR